MLWILWGVMLFVVAPVIFLGMFLFGLTGVFDSVAKRPPRDRR